MHYCLLHDQQYQKPKSPRWSGPCINVDHADSGTQQALKIPQPGNVLESCHLQQSLVYIARENLRNLILQT